MLRSPFRVGAQGLIDGLAASPERQCYQDMVKAWVELATPTRRRLSGHALDEHRDLVLRAAREFYGIRAPTVLPAALCEQSRELTCRAIAVQH